MTKKVIEADEFVQQIKALEYTKDNIQEWSDKIDLCSQLQRICLENKIEISKEEQSMLTSVTSMLAKLRNESIMECTENTERNKERIKIAIKNKIPLLMNHLKEVEEKSNNPKFLEIKEGDDIRARAAEA